MKKVISLLGLSVLLLCLLPVAQAQKFKVLEGDIKALKAIPGLQIEYVYSPMSVGQYEDEADYLSKKIKAFNEKEPGRGDRWVKSWIADRKRRFEPSFEELFNKYAPQTQISPNATYKMIMHTTFTEPGFNVGVHRKNAYIDAVFTILDPEGNVVAKIQMGRAPGRIHGGFDYDTGERIEESYAMAGKALAKKYFGK